MLKDLGIEWTILGHSERRNLFGETDSVSRNLHGSFASGTSFPETNYSFTLEPWHEYQKLFYEARSGKIIVGWIYMDIHATKFFYSVTDVA